MVMTDNLNKNVLGWVVLGVVIVIGSIVLLQIKAQNIANITCPSTNATHLFFNSSANTCCEGTATVATSCATVNSTAVGSVAGTIDTFVAGIAEPQNWVAIVIIAIIGFAILGLFLKKK